MSAHRGVNQIQPFQDVVAGFGIPIEPDVLNPFMLGDLARSLADKHARDRRMLLVRDQVPIATDHLLGLMTDPSIDHPLVDALCGAIRTERLPKDMPSPKLLPPTP
jgi:hypothetical protein